MNYKNIFILLSIFFLSCVQELNITDFEDDYSEYERELRIEAVILPHNNSAIIRIDQSLLITDDSLFDCIDDNDNWIGSGCVCGEGDGFSIEGCPGSEVECNNIGGIWTPTLIGTTNSANQICEQLGEPEGCLDNICILENLTEEQCNHDIYDFNWEIIDDVGIDGLPGDPTDEDEDCEIADLSDENSDCLTEPSEGENNGVTDCGEPNVDDLEEITEHSEAIHLNECGMVKITYDYDDFECVFIWEDEADLMYTASGLIGFANGTGCETGDEIGATQEDLDDLSYNYGAWVPNNDCENYQAGDNLGFFQQRNNNVSYELYIDCNNQIITSISSEKIPYPAAFVNTENLIESDIGSCVNENENEIYDCLKNNNFELNGQQTFIIGEPDNYLSYIATSVWYQAIQYSDPFGDSCNNDSEEDDTWYYYHGHPAVAYPPSESTNHFPPYPSTPIIYTNEEVVVSNSLFDAGCYRYEIQTFSEGYQNYYFSQLDLKDPERSNLRSQGEVVIGSFGIINSKTIDFIIE